MVGVLTSLGEVQGHVASAPFGHQTAEVDEYLGIPFAVPPLGQLRYADPKPLERLPSGALNSLLSITVIRYSITHSLFHSRLKSLLLCKSSLPQHFLFLFQDSLYGFPRLFTVTSEHIRLFTF